MRETKNSLQYSWLFWVYFPLIQLGGQLAAQLMFLKFSSDSFLLSYQFVYAVFWRDVTKEAFSFISLNFQKDSYQAWPYSENFKRKN